MVDEGAPTSTEAEAQRATQRSPRFLLVLGLATAALIGLGSIPAVASTVPVRPGDMALVAGGAYLTNIVSALAYRREGAHGRLYLACSAVEGMVACFGLMWLIYRSGRGDCPLWFFYLLMAALNGSIVDRVGALTALYALPPAVLAVAFALAGDVRATALTVVAGLFCLVVFASRARSSAVHARVVREREAALRELSELRVTRERERAELRVTRERERIARDLHDGIGADLAAIAWRTARLSHTGTDVPPSELSAVSGRATRSIDDLRGIVWALREPTRTWTDLCAFVESRVRDLAGPEAEVIVRASPSDTSLPGEDAVHIVRIVDEAVRNAHQHGHARRYVVTLRPFPRLLVAVEDDGAGLPATVTRTSGLGNLEQRARALGGRLSVRPADPGTLVEVEAERDGLAARRPQRFANEPRSPRKARISAAKAPGSSSWG